MKERQRRGPALQTLHLERSAHLSLLSNWRARKKFIGSTGGRPLWWLVIILILVIVLFQQLGKLESIFPK